MQLFSFKPPYYIYYNVYIYYCILLRIGIKVVTRKDLKISLNTSRPTNQYINLIKNQYKIPF